MPTNKFKQFQELSPQRTKDLLLPQMGRDQSNSSVKAGRKRKDRLTVFTPVRLGGGVVPFFETSIIQFEQEIVNDRSMGKFIRNCFSGNVTPREEDSSRSSINFDDLLERE